MLALAYLYGEGIGVEKDEELARQYYRVAREQLPPGRAALQFSYYYGGDRLVVKAELEEKLLREAAVQGELDAEYILLWRELGNWWEADVRELLPRLEKLAERGHTRAQVDYARRVFSDGMEHGEEQRRRARAFLDSALALNSGLAHSLQGDLLIKGQRGERDFAAAESHYMQSALHMASQIGMGLLHREQRLPDSSPRHAALWYMLCAKREAAECAYWLGRMFRSGEGVEQDPQIANGLLLEAAKKGHKLARAELEKLQME